MARVLVVGRGSPERGGIPTFLAAIMESELASKHAIRYLNLGRPRGTKGGRASASNLMRTFEDIRRVSQAARGADVVHVHSAFAPTVTAVRAAALCLVGRFRGAFTLLHVHGGRFPGWADTPVRRWLIRLIGMVVSRFAAVSEPTAAALGRLVGEDKVRLVPNGIELDRFRPGNPASGDPAVLFVGVLSRRKGLGELFGASRQLRATGMEHQLWIVGGTPDEGEEARQVVEGLAPPWTQWRGELDHDALAGVYARAAVFCLPSWWEAAPLTVLEAMASGLPVVASRVGDLPRMVIDGQTGFLVEPGDTTTLVAVLGKLLDDPALRRAMGERARHEAEARFDLSRTMQMIDDIYGERE